MTSKFKQWVTFLVLILFIATISVSLTSCGGDKKYTLVLLLRTADGLKIGNPIMNEGQKIGTVESIQIRFGHVEAVTVFLPEHRPSLSSRFEIGGAIGEDRFIRVTDPNPGQKSRKTGTRVNVDEPTATIERQIWLMDENA